MTPKPEECEVCGWPVGGPGEAGKCWGGTAACYRRAHERRGVEITVLRAQLEDAGREVEQTEALYAESEVARLTTQLADCAKERDEFVAACRRLGWSEAINCPPWVTAGLAADRLRVLEGAHQECAKERDEARRALVEAKGWIIASALYDRYTMSAADAGMVARIDAALARAEGVGGKPKEET